MKHFSGHLMDLSWLLYPLYLHRRCGSCSFDILLVHSTHQFATYGPATADGRNSMTFPHTLRIILGGILALPALLVLVIVSPIILILSIPSLAILVRRKSQFIPSFAKANDDDDGAHDVISDISHPLLQHAVIVGGSSGIGLSVAMELVNRKCRHVTLVARREDQLRDAQKLVEAAAVAASSPPQNATTTKGSAARTAPSVHIISVDVTDFVSLEREAAKLCGSMEAITIANKSNGTPETQTTTIGPPTLLFNCAGYAIPHSFDDLSPSDFRKQVDVNYLGSIHVVKAFLPHMTQQTHIGGNIILTSSMSGQIGSYGYSAYSPTKFALRGFAECLSMELEAQKANVNVMLAYPPDTKTPGYEVENLKKPEACRLLSESAGIWDPDV
eukprot:scaffold1868_cov194-Alexandrium_tamarense.AAC.7